MWLIVGYMWQGLDAAGRGKDWMRLDMAYGLDYGHCWRHSLRQLANGGVREMGFPFMVVQRFELNLSFHSTTGVYTM